MTTVSRLVLLPLLIAIGACDSAPRIERADPGSVVDYQSGFDEDDAREISKALVTDCIRHPWIENWHRTHDGPPVVIVGELLNNTSEYIDARLMTKSLEQALINTGRVEVVASADERGQLRAEREAGQDWSREETVKRMAYELGADLMLTGWIGEDVEMTPDRKKKVQYYQVSLELVGIESNAKKWVGTHDIEKREFQR